MQKNLRIIFSIKNILFLGLYFGVSVISAQAQVNGTEPKKVKKIEFINADYTEYDKSKGIEAMRIIGKVVMKHEDTYMFADSAYRYMERNAFDAFGRIHIQQGDSLDIYGDTLKYDGETGLALIIGRVRMIDKEVNMNTSQITYDLRKKVAYYPDSAVTKSGDNFLTSKRGSYNSETKEFAFKTNVVIENPNYTVNSDTMNFNSVTETAFFYGPTRILSDESYIYCENGWYDTKRDIASFNKHAFLQSKAQTLRGDSLYYERATGYGLALRNVSLIDTVEKVEIRGHYAESYQNIEKYMVTDSLTLIMKADQDSLFLSSDTLTAKEDSLCGKVITAFHRVKFFKQDFQGSCDSLIYMTGDSLLQMFKKPILWNEQNQLTAKFMQFFMSRGKIKMLDLIETSFIVSKEDSVMFNQISGKNMRGYFGAGELRRVDVFQNGQTIYYPKEENGDVIGANKVDCTDIVIYLENKKVSRIVFKVKPAGDLSPTDKITLSEYKLKGFLWLENLRPLSLMDIYSPQIKVIHKAVPTPIKSGKGKTEKKPVKKETASLR